MKINLIVIITILFLACESHKPEDTGSEILVTTPEELTTAIAEANPGTKIIMKNGEWKNVQIEFVANGTEDQPITLQAETPGKVLIQGSSDLKLGGEYLVVEGLYFKDGASPSNAVIEFAINEDTLANHSRVTNCVIKDFNKSQRNEQDLWVRFRGRHNQLDHCYLAGKSNRGPTIRVDLAGNQSIKNHHKIVNNHFGPRPPKGGPSAETIQLGNSSTSMAPSNTLVANNLFEECNGEVEVISSKSNFNEFRNNVFYKSEGSLVTRHGNYCVIDSNYFIGDENSTQIGGIRLIGTGHWVTNNYFYKLRGDAFRAPLAVMNGIPKSPLNRYIQVTDVVVAFNTWIDCPSPWQFGVGSNIDQKDVLPASEIRSESPIRTIVANNIIYNSEGSKTPIVRYDSINGIDFRSNVINNKGVIFKGVEGLHERNFTLNLLHEYIWVPSSEFPEIEIYKGFEFDQINKDIFGNSRNDNNSIGAITANNSAKSNILDKSLYGPVWHNTLSEDKQPKKHLVNTTKELIEAVTKANDEDIIELASNQFQLNSSLKITRNLTIQSADSINKTTIVYNGKDGSPAFEMHPMGKLYLKSVKLTGSSKNYAFASLKKNMSSLYNLEVEDSEISNFDIVLKAYKYSFSEFIEFNNTIVKNCRNGLELSAENDDRGEYNAENLTIINCVFENIKQNVIDYYRGGYDESTVGGTLMVKGSTFKNCGAEEQNGILINTYGIVNVDISQNLFLNNDVKYVARLWGAKNNSATDNTIENSGRIITEQNLPLKLMY